MIFRRFSLIFITLLCLFASFGCKPKGLDVHGVEGVVTLDGEPFADVTITLFPTSQDGNMGFANTDAQGRYRISALGGAIQQGTTMGTYKIAINKIVPDGKVPTQEEMDAPGYNPRNFTGIDRTKDLVPKKYQMPDTSGFEITVGKGKNTLDFPLVSK